MIPGLDLRLDEPWWLVALPLALLPWWSRRGDAMANAWIAFVPADRASAVLAHALRAAASLAIAALVLAQAGPHRPEYTVERHGRGAEIVLLLDRSRSMDQGFAGVSRLPPGLNPNSREAIEFYFSQAPARLRESKGKVARQLLGEFTARRPDDRFALIVFSTLPMKVLDFTSKPEVIQAAISAGNIGRGLSETNIGRALDAALELFGQRPYTGSRIILLVSDGGDRMDPDQRERLSRQIRQQRSSIYWLYLRSANSPTLDAPADEAAYESVPELNLHRFLGSLDVPYRAYEAGDSRALQQAIDDVDRLEKLPIAYPDLVPRRELAPGLHALALACVLLLIAAGWLERRPLEARA